MMAVERRDSGDLIYDEIVKQVTPDDNIFQILKEPLNRENLIRVNIIQPKILFIDCHGYTNNSNGL
jgi:hypothetical protein